MDILEKINEVNNIRDEIGSGYSVIPKDKILNHVELLAKTLIALKEFDEHHLNKDASNELAECILDAMATLAVHYNINDMDWDSVINIDEKYTDEEAKYVLQIIVATKNNAYNYFIEKCMSRQDEELKEMARSYLCRGREA